MVTRDSSGERLERVIRELPENCQGCELVGCLAELLVREIQKQEGTKMNGYTLKCEACGWVWGITIAEAARFDQLFLRCPKCKMRRAQVVRNYESPWALTGPNVVAAMRLSADELWQAYRAAPDPVSRLAETLLANGQGLEDGGPLTSEDARALASAAWGWASAMGGPEPWERHRMDTRALEALDVVAEWTAVLARVRLLPGELQSSISRAVNALLAAEGDKSAALARYHNRLAAADGDVAIIATLEGLAVELGAAP